MSADVISLRRARKHRKRAEKETVAAENRLRFGRPLAERRQEAATKELESKRLDGLRMNSPRPTEND